jgi:hypothetical protein
MVDVTRHIPSRRAIDRPLAVEFEHISCAAYLAPVCFLPRWKCAGRDRSRYRRLARSASLRTDRTRSASGQCKRSVGTSSAALNKNALEPTSSAPGHRGKRLAV